MASAAPRQVPAVSAAPKPEAPSDKLLAQFTTKFKAGPKVDGRVQNILLIANKLTDTVLPPGEEFSFNRTIGPRTEELGFKNAQTYFMGEILEGIGGGTCQVSSTLHATALHAGLLVTDRHAHSRPSTYIEPGLDATVSYPAECQKLKPDPLVCYDLKLKNPYTFPLRFLAEVGADLDKDEKRTLTISVLGVGEVPKVTTKWSVWATPPFEKRHRRIRYWKDARARIKQAGHPGLEGTLFVTLTYPDGHEEKREIASRYKPVPEVWEVGMAWVDHEKGTAE